MNYPTAVFVLLLEFFNQHLMNGRAETAVRALYRKGRTFYIVHSASESPLTTVEDSWDVLRMASAT